MSLSKAQLQRVRGLQQRKWRRKYAAFLVEGITNVRELLLSTFVIQELFASSNGLEHLKQEIAYRQSRSQFACFSVSPKELERLSTQKTPHEVVAVASIPSFSINEITSCERLLLLDRISDPGNVGTLIRSAEWFGVQAVLSLTGTADWYNPKVVSATRGSLFRLPHLTVSLDDLTQLNESHALLVADLDGVEMTEVIWPEKAVLVIGNESKGPSQEILALNSQSGTPTKITIQAADNSQCESLNAAIAGTLLMSEWLRKKGS